MAFHFSWSLSTSVFPDKKCGNQCHGLHDKLEITMFPISFSSPICVADRSDSFCHIHKNCLTPKVKANHSHKLSNYNHFLKENAQTIAKDDHHLKDSSTRVDGECYLYQPLHIKNAGCHLGQPAFVIYLKINCWELHSAVRHWIHLRKPLPVHFNVF